MTPHFTLNELCESSTARRLLIDNAAPLDVVEHLRDTAQRMERVRELLGGNPIRIDSGYRCAALNKAVCGAPNSAHLYGYAIDFTCAAFGPPASIVAKLRGEVIEFDQMIHEGTWVHLSFDPRMRKQVLVATFTPNGTIYR